MAIPQAPTASDSPQVFKRPHFTYQLYNKSHSDLLLSKLRDPISQLVMGLRYLTSFLARPIACFTLGLAVLLPSLSAVQFVGDGEAHIVGYDNTIYRAFKFRPICGTLAAPAQTILNVVTETCGIAMVPYRNNTTDTFAIYDHAGSRLSDTTPLAQGTEFCMCFSLAEGAGGTGTRANFCLDIASDGEQRTETLCSAGSCVTLASGKYEAGNKSLPQCYDIVVADVTSSLDALGTATRAQVVGPSTSSAPIPPTLSLSTSTVLSSSTDTNSLQESTTSTDNPTGPSTSSATTTPDNTTPSSTKPPRPGGPLGVGIWMPILASLTAAGAGIWYRHRHYRIAKREVELEEQRNDNVDEMKDILKDNHNMEPRLVEPVLFPVPHLTPPITLRRPSQVHPSSIPPTPPPKDY